MRRVTAGDQVEFPVGDGCVAGELAREQRSLTLCLARGLGVTAGTERGGCGAVEFEGLAAIALDTIEAVEPHPERSRQLRQLRTPGRGPGM